MKANTLMGITAQVFSSVGGRSSRSSIACNRWQQTIRLSQPVQQKAPRGTVSESIPAAVSGTALNSESRYRYRN